MILWTSVITLLLVVRLNSDELLSRLNGTPPGQVTFDRTLVSPLVTYVALPLVSLLAARFPAVSSSLFHWVEVVQKIVKG